MVDLDAIWQPGALPWQEAVLQRLCSAAAQDRLPHALLLAGPRGTGKEVFARALAARLLCRVPLDTGAVGACGECDSCQLVAGGGHGDYRWLTPEEGKRVIPIDAVREAIRFVQQTAGYGERKVLALYPAEAMNTASANALLKTLEEPAGNSVLLLISHRPGDLPATVRSRCQTVLLPAPTSAQSADWLVGQGVPIARDHIASALQQLPGGVLGVARAAQANELDARLALVQPLSDLLAGHLDPVHAAEQLAGVDLEMVLELAVSVLENRLRTADRAQLRRQRALFDSYDAVLGWLRAVRNGVNPAPATLIPALCLRMQAA